jgi:hypothetical protein
MLTPQTAFGQEVCWDFIAEAMATKISFTGYCIELNRRYITTNSLSGPFTSHKTFRKALFAWICKMNIDFRAHVDPFCGEDPKILACDGTHLGISAKQMCLSKPVTSADMDFIALPAHKRKQRLFLQDKEANDFLYFLSQRALGHVTEVPPEYTGPSLVHNARNLTTQINALGKLGIAAIMVPFLHHERHCLKPCAEIFKLLCCSNKAAMTAVFPFSFHKHLQHVCNEFLVGRGTANDLREMRKYLPPAASLIEAYKLAKKPMTEPANFLLQMVELTISIHEKDRPTLTSPRPIPGSYNPTEGCAYYFHKHGCQVRELPHYEVGEEIASGQDACRKMYPKISMGGFGYMFLYFCPEHGHCYGFHLIKSSEGRKDPFYPLLKYKKTPPTDLYYDNACQLCEYSLNREPEYCKNIRFWHDLFHSFTHKGCGHVFKSKRVHDLLGVNSEVCEQFNAYIQCVKYTACKMTKSNFMLYVQFMVYLWNLRKTANYQNMYNIAVAGTM